MSNNVWGSLLSPREEEKTPYRASTELEQDSIKVSSDPERDLAERNREYQKKWYHKHKTKYPQIFAIFNEITGDVYICKTRINVKKRFQQYRAASAGGISGKVANAMREYGKDNFSCKLLVKLKEGQNPEREIARHILYGVDGCTGNVYRG